LQSSRQLIEQAKRVCLDKTELQFMEDAITSCNAEKNKDHPNNSGGTSAKVRQCVMKKNGVSSSIQDATLENVDLALRKRQGVIMSADVEVLWENQGVPPQPGRHAVVITHGEYSQDGNLTGVYINDTGINKRYFLTADELSDCLQSGSGQLNVTDNPIWPND
jgi:hypothetical protein